MILAGEKKFSTQGIWSSQVSASHDDVVDTDRTAVGARHCNCFCELQNAIPWPLQTALQATTLWQPTHLTNDTEGSKYKPARKTQEAVIEPLNTWQISDRLGQGLGAASLSRSVPGRHPQLEEEILNLKTFIFII